MVAVLEQMQPLVEADYDELDEYVRGRFVAAARASLADEALGTPLWDATMGVAMREALSIRWNRRPGLELLTSDRRGLARLVWQSVKRAAPGVTLAACYAALETERERQTAWEELARKNGWRAATKSTNTTGNKEEAKPPAGPTESSPETRLE